MSDAALRASEIQYRRLFEAAKDGILMLDAVTGEITAVNPFLADLLGYAASDILGKKLWEISPFEDITHSKILFEELQRNAYVRYEDVPLETRHGRLIDVEFVSNIYLSGDRRVIQCNIRDITERKTAERARRTSDERIRFVLEAAHIGIWDLDSNTGVLEWSDVLEDQYGIPRGTFGGTFDAFIDRVHPEDRALVLAAIHKATRTGGDFATQHRTIRPDGSVRALAGNGRILVDAAGHPTRAIGISQDVTDRSTLQAQFHQAQKMEAIGRLAGGVAHDFNNLLTVMLGCCEMLLDGNRQTDEDRHDIEQIQKASLRAAALTGQLLALSRKQIINPTVLDVTAILENLRPMLARLIREDVHVVFGGCPDVAPIKADRGQLEQVILNLAVNAQDAMPSGGTLEIDCNNIELDMHHQAEDFDVLPGRYVVISVTDTGTGMTPEVIARMFEPFFTTKAAGKGTGLGLATVHGIVAQSGGSVSVHSEPGLGSRFDVYFPQATAAAAAVELLLPSGASLQGNELLLVVEDADGLRDLTKRLLERLGYAVLVAANATEALDVFDTYPSIALVLTDVVMPGQSGPELTRQLRERRPGLKVVYMSGYTDEAIV
ncbi:MAG: PAS domain S-box protein [Acidobacteria bacterium]|nr:PAS domain S-box protein [Acidobacteriota bacterium]